MTDSSLHQVVGAVDGVWRYPVKSMMGERIASTLVNEHGLLGDRAYALVDQATGKVASAKNPRKWPGLFEFKAAFVEPPQNPRYLPPVRVEMPDGSAVLSLQPDADQILSRAITREVTLRAKPPANPELEEYWPDMEQLAHRDAVTEEAMPAETFFDCAMVHLLTTATLARLRQLYPDGAWEIRRFRPNLLIESAAAGFVENSWVGRTLAIGAEVRLQITGHTGRCVMTTLAQGPLPRDLEILKTAVRWNQSNVGVYASVLRGGTVRDGDAVTLL